MKNKTKYNTLSQNKLIYHWYSVETPAEERRFIYIPIDQNLYKYIYTKFNHQNITYKLF